MSFQNDFAEFVSVLTLDISAAARIGAAALVCTLFRSWSFSGDVMLEQTVRFSMCAAVCTVPLRIAKQLEKQKMIFPGGWCEYTTIPSYRTFNDVVYEAARLWGKESALRGGTAYIVGEDQ